jgi:competence protein ComEC
MCLGLIALFILITGSSAPIVRAGIVSALTIGAWYYGRRVKPAVLLCVAAAVSALMNPLYIWGNVSWYLSFLAFYGVLVLAPLIAKRFWGEKEPGVLAGIALESACASLMVLPYMLYVFGDASLMSLPANVLVLPLVPLAMLLALVAGLGGMLTPMLAGWLAWPAKELMTYMLDMANVFSRVPHAFVSGVGVSFVAMATLYGAIGTVSLTLLAKAKQRHGIITENERDQ